MRTLRKPQKLENGVPVNLRGSENWNCGAICTPHPPYKRIVICLDSGTGCDNGACACDGS